MCVKQTARARTKSPEYNQVRACALINRYVSCGGGGGGRGRAGRIRRDGGQSGGRHGSRRTGFGRGCALEAHPAEHVHAMGKRASEDGWQSDRKLGNRPGRRAPADCAHRGAQRQTAAEAQ